MIPKVFKELIAACNACILACEECIRTAKRCEKNSASDSSCKEFIERTKDCTASCEVCIKACDAMIAEFNNEGHDEHREILSTCVKELGENVRILRDSANKCSVDAGCRVGALEAQESCNRAIKAADECIESCQKHEVYYLHITKM